jgi:hypothetical protein
MPASPRRRSSLSSWLLVLVALAGVGCRRHPTTSPAPLPHRAFYYWRTTLAISGREAQALSALHADRLYLRLFDVDWNDTDPSPHPVAPLAIARAAAGEPPLPAHIEPVPVVFIRERVLRRLTPATARELAADIWRTGQAKLAAIAPTARAHELQIDCDWTDSTRAAYFALLEGLAEHARPAGTALTATIRLHQIKYRERTGVPPVARGMLMFYNMGRIEADPDAQAIFDPERAAAYLARLADYPLPLDVALPIWSWVRHVRGDRVVGLMQDTGGTDLASHPWLRPAGARRFEVTETAFLDGVLLRRGDSLDVEESTPSTTRAAAALLAARLAAAPAGRTIALFHLSEKNLARYEDSDLDQVFASLR